MSIFKPSFTINGAQLRQIVGLDSVYAWKRNGKFLYVGLSASPIARILNHNIVGKAEPVLDTDEIQIMNFDEYSKAAAVEADMNMNLKPVYSFSPAGQGTPKSKVPIICPVCKTPFMQKRSWQKFCSIRCRSGIQLS